MIATIVVGIIALFFAFLYDRKATNWGLVIAMVILTLFCAVRWEWGNDMPGYLSGFYSYGGEGLKFWEFNKFSLVDTKADRANEIGWIALNLLCQPIGFFGMTILLSLFEGGVIYWFIKRYVPRGYVTFAIFLYVFNINLMVLGCSMMRQWLAICVILIAVYQIEKGSFFRFLMLVALASSFHTSAIICLLMYPIRALRNLKFKTKDIVLFTGIVVVWVFVLGPFIVKNALSFLNIPIPLIENYSDYAKSSDSASTVGLASLLNVLVIIICIYALKRASSEKVRITTWVYSIYLIFLPVVSTLPMSSRLMFYFNPLMLSVYPNGILNIKEKVIKWCFFIWVVFWNLYLFFSFFHDEVWIDSYYEYRTIFEAPGWM